MKDYNYWLTSWPKICFSTFANGGRMFESIQMKDDNGIWHYKAGREFTLDEALANAHPDRRVPTIAIFDPKYDGGKHA